MSAPLRDSPRFGPYGFLVPATVRAVSEARGQIMALVERWHLPLADSALCDVELLSSELITNAVVHTQAPSTVCVSWNGEQLRVEVTDIDPQLPAACTDPAELLAESGRGLVLVRALAAEWGAQPDPAGKRVWFAVGTNSRLTGDERLTALVRVAAPLAESDLGDPPSSKQTSPTGSGPGQGRPAIHEMAGCP